MTPHTRESPCPVCGGCRELPQGQGVRCFGFVSADGDYAHCTREELAGSIAQHAGSQAFPHRLRGDCRCGRQHGPAEVRGIGEAKGARVVETYDYTDEEGALLYQVVRKEPKTFVQRRQDGRGGWIWSLEGVRVVPYRLRALQAAVGAGDTIHIVEGEKDVHAVEAAGGVATCNSGGAGKWRQDFGRHFEGAHVVIVRDQDAPGKRHARDVFRSLRGIAYEVRVVDPRSGKDAADHLAAGHALEDFIPVWPLDALRQSDPVAWKRAIVRRSLDPGDPFRTLDPEVAADRREPTWPTGLEGEPSTLPNLRGVTILTGGPSSGKSYLALASSIQATFAGWDVIYLSSEMGDRTLAQRIRAYCGELPIPSTLHVVCVSFGASVEALVERVSERLGARPTLVVFDSVSSFVDQAPIAAGENDVHQIGPLRQLLMWALNVKRHTEGQVSFLLLSETNKEGRTKGRFGDHKADLVLTLRTEPEHPSVKEIVVTKGWEYETGRVGLFGLDTKTARLRRLE